LAKVGSTAANTNSEIAGMFERSGSTFAPAGIMWSVVMLSPTLRRILPQTVSGRGVLCGNGLMLGPRTISTESGLSGGGITIRSSVRYFSGAVKLTGAPSFLGSVMTP